MHVPVFARIHILMYSADLVSNTVAFLMFVRRCCSVGELVCVLSGHPYKAGVSGLILLIC